MTIARVKPGSWVSGEELTYPQINALDTNVSHALDKTTAGDTLAGAIVLASTASITCQSGSAVTCQSGATLGTQAGCVATLAGTTLITGTSTISGAMSFTVAPTIAGGLNLLMNARTVIRVMTGGVYDAGLWNGVNPPLWAASAAAQSGNAPITFELKVPHGAVLTTVLFELMGAGGHAFAPGTMPIITVQKIAKVTGAITTIGSPVSDTSSTPGGSPTGYEAAHFVAVSLLTETIDRVNNRYVAMLTPETGAHILVGSPLVWACVCTWNQTTYEED